MPRNAAGVYSLPTGNPVIPGTIISSTWANTTLSDIATALTNSLSVDKSVTTSKLNDGAVTTIKIADKAVTAAKLANDAVTGDKIADDAIGAQNLLDDSSEDPMDQKGVQLLVVMKDSPTGGAKMPAGTIAERTPSPVFGAQRANTDTGEMEWWNGSRWSSMGGGAIGTGPDAVFFENDLFVTQDYVIGQNDMLPCTISIGSPAVITQPNNYVAGQPIRFETTGTLPVGIIESLDDIYYVLATGLSSTSFQISTTPGGAAVNTSGTQSGVQSCGALKNAGTFGPITILDGVVVEIPRGSVWSIV